LGTFRVPALIISMISALIWVVVIVIVIDRIYAPRKNILKKVWVK
jgi:hypothetical protein